MGLVLEPEQAELPRLLPPTNSVWGMFEVEAHSRSDNNPFVDYAIEGIFVGEQESVTVDGFYDGEDIYRVRFIPSFEGQYTYECRGSFSDVVSRGSFAVTPPSKDNHSPIRITNQYHFAYEDGTAYNSVGTTCYVWTHQPEEQQEMTLAKLKKGYFNKTRFCVFPKHYVYNLVDPITFPYEGKPMDASTLTRDNFMNAKPDQEIGNRWDFTRTQPAHFHNHERRIVDLMDIGIEADIIMMNPYDRWGLHSLSLPTDTRTYQPRRIKGHPCQCVGTLLCWQYLRCSIGGDHCEVAV